MLLDKPAFSLLISDSDLPGILKAILKERHWRNFEVASADLVYVPHWLFNFDVYYESPEGIQTYSSQMSMNAVTGELNPILVEILKEIPVNQSKEIPENAKVEPVAVSLEEAKDVSKIKIAGELKLPKDKITTYGFRLVYLPVYKTWVKLGKKIQRIEIDGISGSPMNIQEVPERKRGFIEITKETLEALTTPEGWMDYSKKAGKWITDVAKATGGAVAGQFKKGGIINWLLFTRPGQYTLLVIIIMILLYLVLRKYGRI